MKVLAGDVGGTHTRLAIVDLTAARTRWVAQRDFPSGQAHALAPLVRAFLREAGTSFTAAGFGVAGPVVDGQCQTPNLPWVVSERVLARTLGLARVALINDFVALGHAVPRLSRDDLVTLHPGVAEPGGVIAILGAGTGLGHAYIVRCGRRTVVLASEGGHASFAPQDDVQWNLHGHLQRQYGHVSAERVISGPGLADAYRVLATQTGGPETHPLDAAPTVDRAAEISRRALAGTDPAAGRALDLFVKALGARAGDLALTVLATGGVYLGGGIAPQILAKLQDGTLLRAFLDKGRLAELLERIPIHVIVNPLAGVLGAAVVARGQ